MRGTALCRASKKRAAKLERWSTGSRSFHANINLQCKHICTRTDADRHKCLQHAKKDPIAWVQSCAPGGSQALWIRRSPRSSFGVRFLVPIWGPFSGPRFGPAVPSQTLGLHFVVVRSVVQKTAPKQGPQTVVKNRIPMDKFANSVQAFRGSRSTLKSC